MSQDERQERRVSIYCVDGIVEGNLATTTRLRTLDELNNFARGFLTIHSPKVVRGPWKVDEKPLAFNKTSILFVREYSLPPAQSRGLFGSFTRASLQLLLGGYSVQGFVHVPTGGSSLKRLDQDKHPFLALTTALVSGHGEEFTVPFLAVNKSLVTAAQESLVSQAADPVSTSSARV